MVMKKRIIAILTGLITTLNLSAVPMVQAETSGDKYQFTCNQGFDKNTGKEQPTTYLWYEGKKHSVLSWVKTSGSTTPQERCNKVSSRLQEAYDNGSLNFVTNGSMNGQAVICTAREYGGNCDTLILTLRPNDNPLEILNGFKEALSGRRIGIDPMPRSSTTQIYYKIDLQETIRNTHAE
jgi:hypothetical protein